MISRHDFPSFLLAIVGFASLGSALTAKPARIDYARLPMNFEPNVGQAPAGVHFVARGASYAVRLENAGPVLLLKPALKAPAHRIAISFPGGRTRIEPKGVDRLEGKVNYLVGNRSRGWHRNVPTYGHVRYEAVYPGIDVVYYGQQGRLEYDFQIAPHADPSRIRLRFEGAGRPQLDEAGDLVFANVGDALRQHQPVAYQERDGTRTSVEVRYRMLPSGDASLALGGYDPELPLVIDPTLSYATYLGGAGNDGIASIKVDATGALYVAGFTNSTSFTTVGGVQSGYKGTNASGQFLVFGDAFVAKFSPSGALVYSTYLGGSDDDLAAALAIDASGNAYVAGATRSVDFPVTSGAFQTKFGGASEDPFIKAGDAFVVKLSPDGGQILYGTYLGGSMNDMALGIAVDVSGNVAVVGATLSTNFPTTADAIFPTFRGAANLAIQDTGDGFLTRLDATGKLLYSTYIGGRSHDFARGVALDAQGNVYLCGSTFSSDFPVTDGVVQKTFHGLETSTDYNNFSDDAWVMKVSAQGTIVYSTYLGGSSMDTAFGIAVDASGSAYVTGHTMSKDFPVTDNSKYGGTGANGQPGDFLLGDAFVSKLTPDGSALVYSTYLGGPGDEIGNDIVVDAAGNAYVVGYTLSTNFPVTGDALQKTFGGLGGQGYNDGAAETLSFGDAFITKLDPQGTLLYSSFFGGTGDDIAMAVAVDSGMNVYIAGNTVSQNLPLGSNPFQATYGGNTMLGPRGDAFVAKFDFGGKLQAVPNKISFLSGAPTSGAAGAILSPPVTVQVVDSTGVAIEGVSVTFAATNASVNPTSAMTDASGQASTTVTLGNATGAAQVTAAVAGLAAVNLNLTVTAAVQAPVVGSVVNAASFLQGVAVAPGSMITLFGTGLATARGDASTVPLPTNLGGTKVRVNNILIPLIVVLSTQINAQLPYEIGVGTANVTVELNSVVSAAFTFEVQAASPGIFVYGNNRAVAQNVALDGSATLNTSSNAVIPGQPMVIYLTGEGLLDHPVASGAAAVNNPLSHPAASYSVTVGGEPAVVDFVGMTPGLVALGQANIHVPGDLKPGDYAVVITIGGQLSNGPNISVGKKP
jgi:uncharacterized protein (TIGR03437 family)